MSSWEANGRSSDQDFIQAPHLYNTKMFFFIRCSHEPAAIPCIKQKNPPYTVTQSSIKLHFNIIPSPIFAFVKWPLHLRFSHIILHAFFNFLMAVTHQAFNSWLHPASNFRWATQIMALIIMQFSPFPCHFPQRQTFPFSTLSLCS